MLKRPGLCLALLVLLLMASLVFGATPPEPGKPNSVLYFKTSSCPYCVKFEQETKPFVACTLYTYSAESQEAALKSYGITSFPAFVVFDYDGNWRKHEGFLNATAFDAWIRQRP